MLCAIRSKDNEKVFANNSEKDELPFFCPKCNDEVNLKKGRIRVHHFAHKPPFNCKHGEGETEVHRKCKQSIFNALAEWNEITNLEVEANLGLVISDIYFRVKNVTVAVEIQKSSLSVNEITARTSAYEKLGVHVLWLALYNKNLEEERYSPKAWEKWCHAMFFGRVYYWRSDLTIIPVHFSEYQIYVEPSNWYDEYGDEQFGGDYYKTSKRYKTPVFGKNLNLISDFKPISKNEWTGGSVYLPKCKIFQDKLKKWW